MASIDTDFRIDAARELGVTLRCYARREMDAAVWTAIGLLAATSLGTLFYLGSRIDSLAARLDTRIDAGFARVDTRFDAIESRLDGLASRFDAHLDQHA